MALHRFHRAELLPQPWKNGGGVTTELACLPVGASMAQFDWRVSIAHIASSGPFSAFPGIDRVITLLEGEGVALRSPDEHIGHRLDTPLQPFAFDGAADISAELLGPDCHDFNVMTRRTACQSRVEVLHGATSLPAAHQGLLYNVAGSWRVNGQTLAPDEGLWWTGEPCEWKAEPEGAGAALIAVLIEMHTRATP